MFLEIYNPSPVPLKDLINFVNSLGNISGLIPEPVSSTVTIASS
jgi:hypothetical protein